MERAKILINLMSQKNMKVADISKKTGIAYSTVKSILENGVGKTSYINVQKICKALNITTDDLEAMVESNNRTTEEVSYQDLITVYTRNKKSLSQEEKIRLARIILSENEE